MGTERLGRIAQPHQQNARGKRVTALFGPMARATIIGIDYDPEGHR
jgi:hypothetical protein